MGGFKYVSKITDEFTKYMDIYLIKTKGGAFGIIHLYVQSVTHPSGLGSRAFALIVGQSIPGKPSGITVAKRRSTSATRRSTHLSR